MIIFALGLITLGLKMGANQAIALATGEEETELIAEAENPEADTQATVSTDDKASVDESEETPENPSEGTADPAEDVADQETTSQEENTSSSETEEAVPTQTVSTNQSDNAPRSVNAATNGDYKVIAGCFQNPEYSERRVSLLQGLGYPAAAKQLRNSYPDADGLNSVIVNRYEAYNSALADITALRDEHSIESYLVKRGQTRTDGMTAYITIDISDPMFPKETSTISWMFD